MKKAFSMIELIMVIVILGILASVALPKLVATRDDAEVVKAATNINIFLSDVKAYYLARDELSKVSDMSSVIPPVQIRGNVCLLVTSITPDGILYMNINDQGLCSEVWKFSKFRDLKEKIVANGNKLDISPLSVKFQ